MAMFILYFVILFLLFLVAQNNTRKINFTSGNYDSSSYLDPEINNFCPKNDTMFIKGFDVKVSDFVRTNGDIYNLCGYKTALKFVNVFALNNLIIDVDVDVSGSFLNMFFIAPTWVVIGNRKISVDGSKGDYIPKARDGNITDIDGQDGIPGLPGGPGGNFVGVGELFVNGKSLTITANGGIGGTGQYGGNGYNPEKGRHVDTNALGKMWCGLYYDMCRGKDKQYQLNLLDNHGNYSDFYCQGLYEKENMESCSYKIFGWEGKEGGKGGNGGRGGKGGLPGSVKILDLTNSSRISTHNTLGKYGKDGSGGIGGRSGQDGPNVIYEDVYFLAPPKIKFEIGQEYNYRFGPNGSDGCNAVDNGHVVESEALEPQEILNIINEFKRWSRERSVNTDSVTFYKRIDENIYIRNLSNTSEFLNEVQSIDEAFRKSKSTVDFLPFYESLLGRIYFYAETYINDTARVEDRQILSMLYTEILGRIYNFNEHAETYLVVQIPQYLELVQENLQKISQLIMDGSGFSSIAEKANELNKYKENYDSQVQRLIEKSRHYVDVKLIVETEDLINDESIKMSTLVRDIIRLKERPLNNEQELLRSGKHMHDSLVVRSNIGFVRLINKMFITLADFAEIVSSVVEVGAGVPEVLRLGEKTNPETEFNQETFNKFYNKTEAIKTEEVSRISSLLQNILNITKRRSEILFDVTEDVLVVQKKLQKNYRFLTVNALRSDLLEAVKIKRDELQTINLYPDFNISAKAYKHILTARSAFTELSRIIKINTLSREFVNLYDEYKHDDGKLDTVIEYINKAYNILHNGKMFEDSIYFLVYQLLQRIEDITLDASENSDSVSKLAIEVIKWKIPLILDKIKKQTQQYSDGHQGTYIIKQIIGNLGGTCSAFTGVFDRIANYLQQKQLENHFADTTYATNKGINFTDVLFSNKYETIKQSFGSNLVLQHYKKAADTFKQYVFPLADVYFRDIILPSHFNMYENISNTVDVAITQIDLMLEKVEEYKKSMLDGDGIVERKDFGGRKFRSQNPFFVWKNEQYKDIIEQLLSGNEVTVNAEISKSELSDHAIKFNRIDFYFTSNNESIQESVNFIMADFEINVSHLGNSHYRYGDDIYLITSDSLDITYCFENDEDTGEPAKTGGAYDFIKNVDITISPYALWKIRLTPLWEEVSFKRLLALKDYVDLEMGGNGYYITKEKISTLDLKVEKFYKPL